MERNLKMLIALCAVGIIGLAYFATAIGTPAPVRTVDIPAGTGSLDSATQSATTQAGGARTTPAGDGGTAGPQVVSIRALDTGAYDKQEVHVKAGVPVRFEFSADAGAGCGKLLVIPDFNVRLVSGGGETQTAEFTPQKGVYAYRCGMNMFRGKLYAD